MFKTFAISILGTLTIFGWAVAANLWQRLDAVQSQLEQIRAYSSGTKSDLNRASATGFSSYVVETVRYDLTRKLNNMERVLPASYRETDELEIAHEAGYLVEAQRFAPFKSDPSQVDELLERIGGIYYEKPDWLRSLYFRLGENTGKLPGY